jgi:hypothetical protein
MQGRAARGRTPEYICRPGITLVVHDNPHRCASDELYARPRRCSLDSVCMVPAGCGLMLLDLYEERIGGILPTTDGIQTPNILRGQPQREPCAPCVPCVPC